MFLLSVGQLSADVELNILFVCVCVCYYVFTVGSAFNFLKLTIFVNGSLLFSAVSTVVECEPNPGPTLFMLKNMVIL